MSKTQGMPHCSVPVQAMRTGTYFLQNYLLDEFLEFLVNHFTPRKPKVFKPSLESSFIHTQIVVIFQDQNYLPVQKIVIKVMLNYILFGSMT